MAREIAISLYLALFRMIFSICKLFPLRSKTTFVASFGGNITETVKQLEHQVPGHAIVVLQTSGKQLDLTQNKRRIMLDFVAKNPFDYIRGIYHLATSRHVIADNYYGFLAATNFSESVQCSQLWHANGAIKQFGLEDKSIGKRSDRALNRFKRVYNRFNYVTVGSEKMKEIFKRSFGLPEERFIRSGVPRTDFFFDDANKQLAMKELELDFPVLHDKRMILYAPTYRDGEFSQDQLKLDIIQMHEHLSDEYVLFLRLHPAVTGEFENLFPDFSYDVSKYSSINRLLVGTDILITDYSSIPFEYSLLGRPMIFYAYDYEAYAKQRGVWDDYAGRVPGKVATTTTDIIDIIEQADFALEKVKPFADEWNLYSKGASSKALVQSLYHDELFSSKKEIRELG